MEGLKLLKVNKVVIFTQLIIFEVFIIIALVSFLLFDSCVDNSNYSETTITDSSLILSKNKSTPFTGKMQDTLINNIIVEFNVVDGFKQGEYIILTMDGNCAVTGYMHKNKNHGNWKYYYENGQLECSGNFDNDKPIGKWTWFYENGYKKCEGVFINGKEEGRWLKYDDTGSPCLLMNYSLGDVISFVNINNLTKV